MKQNTPKKYNKQLFTKNTLILLLISTQHSTGSINNQNVQTQIKICSHHQNINTLTNTLTITGNVVINNNHSYLYADKVIITYSKKHNEEKTINAYGNPVIFYQSKNHKKKILATSLHMSFNKIDNTIILQGQVFLKKENHTLQSDYVIYTIKEKYIETHNNKNYQKNNVNN